ncbi:unnamed protein product [Linum tenue]|uniref:Uncharacterized protein n=1 Tax=Linum tenue TaxID=586396 RepID=A0AAV0H7H4_9ROSI|nr:unnamed protein product [Linum tenue]
MDEDNKSPACVPDKIGETTLFSVEKSTLGIDPSGKMEDSSPSVSDIHANDMNGSHENTVAAEDKSGYKNLGRRQIAEVETVGPTKDAREGKNLSIKRAKSGGDPDKDRLIANLKTLQDYLCSFTSQGLTVANISARTFPQTLDWLHGYPFQSICRDFPPVSKLLSLAIDPSSVLSKKFHQCPMKTIGSQLKIELLEKM